MKYLEIISWIAHRLAMAFACITIGFVLAFMLLKNDMGQISKENVMLRQLILHCQTEPKGMIRS